MFDRQARSLLRIRRDLTVGHTRGTLQIVVGVRPQANECVHARVLDHGSHLLVQ